MVPGPAMVGIAMGTMRGSCLVGFIGSLSFGKIRVREMRKSKIPPEILMMWPVMPKNFNTESPQKPNRSRIKRAMSISLIRMAFCLFGLKELSVAI